MHDAAGIAAHFANSLDHSRAETAPYRHWLLHDGLPPETCAAIDALPYAPPPIGDTHGRRETNNSTRLFFGAAARAQHAICNQLALALQSNAVVQRIESICGIDLTGFFLRIEYCLDTDGFWLEPHTDIGVKRFTMLI